MSHVPVSVRPTVRCTPTAPVRRTCPFFSLAPKAASLRRHCLGADQTLSRQRARLFKMFVQCGHTKRTLTRIMDCQRPCCQTATSRATMDPPLQLARSHTCTSGMPKSCQNVHETTTDSMQALHPLCAVVCNHSTCYCTGASYSRCRLAARALSCA